MRTETLGRITLALALITLVLLTPKMSLWTTALTWCLWGIAAGMNISRALERKRQANV